MLGCACRQRDFCCTELVRGDLAHLRRTCAIPSASLLTFSSSFIVCKFNVMCVCPRVHTLSPSQRNAHGLVTVFFLGTEPDGLLRTNYTSVLTNVGAALHGFHDVMKGEL